MIRRTPLKRIRPERAKERREYRVTHEEYLKEHPFCQICIFMASLNEAAVIAQNGRYGGIGMQMKQIPRSTQIHHRNKARGGRLLDRRFWMAASYDGHELVENNKNFAREVGLLLPFEADENGLCPNGEQCLTTPQLMEKLK